MNQFRFNTKSIPSYVRNVDDAYTYYNEVMLKIASLPVANNMEACRLIRSFGDWSAKGVPYYIKIGRLDVAV